MTLQPTTATPPRISLMALADLRDALTALELGQAPTAITALMAIDDESWRAVEQRLATVGGDLRTLLGRAGNGFNPLA
ncbi:hypothetical protein [Streptomyces sp. NPDC021020]|uniref:hypothetical protein n=1 Tax=Streptomyces sp. NPDC021020 TaxID=3365109 RepID=UPI0037955387